MGDWDLGVCSFFGAGLGNLLFAWSRAMIAAKRDGLVEIWPTWRQFIHRDSLRDAVKDMLGFYGPRGLRNYRHLFAPTGTQICGFQKLRLLLTRRHVSEENYSPERLAAPEGSIVIFKGYRRTFADILTEHSFLRQELLSRCQLDLKEVMSFDFSRSISVHVRLGDFNPAGSSEEIGKFPVNIRLPLSWYLEKIAQFRSRFGESIPVHVFSDGKDSELAKLLALPHCRRLGFGNALADMFAMARANVLICSGSSLNRWGAFLGRSPAIHPPAVNQTHLYYDQPDAEVESGSGQELPETFLRLVEIALSKPKQVSSFA